MRTCPHCGYEYPSYVHGPCPHCGKPFAEAVPAAAPSNRVEAARKAEGVPAADGSALLERLVKAGIAAIGLAAYYRRKSLADASERHEIDDWVAIRDAYQRAGRAVSAPPPVPEALCAHVTQEICGRPAWVHSGPPYLPGNPHHAFVAAPPVAPAPDRLAEDRTLEFLADVLDTAREHIMLGPNDNWRLTKHELDAVLTEARRAVLGMVERASSPVALQQDEIERLRQFEVQIHEPFTSVWADKAFRCADRADAETQASELRARGFDTRIVWRVDWQRGEWVAGARPSTPVPPASTTGPDTEDERA